MTTCVTRLSCIDELIQSASAAGYDARYAQMEPGQLQGQWDEIDLGECFLARERINLGVEFMGSGPVRSCSFIFVTRGHAFFANGHEPGKHKLYLAPPGSEIHCVTGGAVDVTTITIPESALAIIGLRGYQIHRILDSRVLTALNTSPSTDHLLAEMISLLQADILNPVERQTAVERLLNTLAHAAERGTRGMLPAMGKTVRRQQFLRAHTYIRDNIDSRILSEDLATHLHMSQRSVERLFSAESGLSPRQYIKIQRLNSAMLQFRLEAGGKKRVHAVALDNGYMHMGRFSGDFKKLFGVLPSEVGN